MKDYAAISWRNMKRRKKRLVLTVLGVVLSCALITAITTMLYSFQQNELITAARERERRTPISATLLRSRRIHYERTSALKRQAYMRAKAAR